MSDRAVTFGDLRWVGRVGAGRLDFCELRPGRGRGRAGELLIPFVISELESNTGLYN